MSSNLRVNNIFPSVGTNVAIGTAGGSITLTGSTTGDITSSGVSTFSNIRITGGTISGVSTAGITTAYIGSVNDGPISGARNRIINGDMRIDQRNAGASVTPTTLTFGVDRWGSSEQTDGSITLQQSGTVPVGFTSSLLVTVTSADSSLGATQYAILRQGIEGVNISDLNWGTSNARPVTLSFWVRSSLTGAFGGAIQNNAQDRSYPFSYTINSANTFEYKTVTIPGDTTGTWLTNNSAGMFVWFSFAAGSTYSGTAATWASSLLFAPTDATNLLGTNGATWYLTGVQLESGTVATPFERRSYGQELALCQRYYFKTKVIGAGDDIGTGCSLTTTSAQIAVSFPVEMRTNVTSIEQTGTAGDYSVRYPGGAITCSGVPTYYSGTKTHGVVALPVSSGLTAGQGAFLRGQTANAYIAWSVEL